MFAKVNKVDTIEIMLVEDNPGDARLAKEALSECNIKNNLTLLMMVKKLWTFSTKEVITIQRPGPTLYSSTSTCQR